VLGMLWTDPQFIISETGAGRLLRANRHLFVGKHVYNAFAGYAHGQMEKMETRDPADLRLYVAVTNEAKRRGIHPNHKGDRFDIPLVSGEDLDAQAWGNERIQAAIASYHKKGENIGYMGDKRKQLVLRHGYDSKNAAHLIRLLRMCKEFLATGEMTVLRPDAVELLEIKRGAWPLEQVKRHAESLFEECKAARDASTLPNEPDRAAVNKLLFQILKEHICDVN